MTTMQQPSIILNERERAILDAYFEHGTYRAAAEAIGTSHSTVYKVVLKAGARKYEDRIRQRAAAREAEREQTELLRQIVGTSVTADVLDFAHGLPSNSVALVASSLPYNVGRKYGNHRASDRDSFLAYRGKLMILVSEIERILRPGGVAFLNVGTTHDDLGRRAPIDKYLFHFLVDSGLSFVTEVFWPSQHGLTPKRRPADRMETALVFSKGEVATFNPAAARQPTKEPGKRYFHGPNKGEISSHPLGAFPSNVWADIKHLGHNHPELTDHPAQWPIALAMRAILLWTLPGDLVCDFFVGSGSTQIASLRSGRQFVGCDLFYDELRSERLANVVPDRVSPLPGVTDESMAVWAAEARRRDVPAQPITQAEEEQLALAFLPRSAA